MTKTFAVIDANSALLDSGRWTDYERATFVPGRTCRQEAPEARTNF